MSHPLIIDGGIISGGLANRMNGADKGLQLFNNKPMAQWVFNALSPVVRKVIINCNRNESSYKEISPHITSDSISGFPGPLAGLISIMEFSDADYFLISPCDTPLLSEKFVKRLLTTLHRKIEDNPNIQALLAVQTTDKKQPLHLCISKYYQDSLRKFVDSGNSKVMLWMSENNAQWVDFSDEAEMFKNFNTLEEVNTY